MQFVLSKLRGKPSALGMTAAIYPYRPTFNILYIYIYIIFSTKIWMAAGVLLFEWVYLAAFTIQFVFILDPFTLSVPVLCLKKNNKPGSISILKKRKEKKHLGLFCFQVLGEHLGEHAPAQMRPNRSISPELFLALLVAAKKRPRLSGVLLSMASILPGV